MGRMARVVVPNCSHHVTQRGVRSMRVFSSEEDRGLYLKLVREQGAKHGVEFVAYCLMDNHIHLIVLPESGSSLAKAIGDTHRLYSLAINARNGVKGYLFQGRFYSCPMDERHFISAAAYVESNPVRAGICTNPWEYPWSSSAYHCGRKGRDPLVERHIPGFTHDEWARFTGICAPVSKEMKIHFRTGRPYGSAEFISRVERLTGRDLRPKRRGPKPEPLEVN